MHLKVKACLVSAAMGAAFVGVVSTSTTASAATCPDNSWSIKDPGYDTFNASGVNTRSGPSTSCTSLGQGQVGQEVSLHCYKFGPDGRAWDHIYNLVTGTQGWVRSDFLTGGGSLKPC